MKIDIISKHQIIRQKRYIDYYVILDNMVVIVSTYFHYGNGMPKQVASSVKKALLSGKTYIIKGRKKHYFSYIKA